MILVDSFITVDYDDLKRREWEAIFKRLRFIDADGVIYEPWQLNPRKRKVKLPRGAWSQLPDRVKYLDQRSFPKMRRLETAIELDAELADGRKFSGQKKALETMFEQEQGLIIRPPGTGKTQIALAFAARVKTRTLVLVHTEDILQQWIEYAERAIPGVDIGVIRADEIHVGHLTLSTVQTFHKLIAAEPKEWGRKFGAVILDEAHHAPAATFEQCLNLLAAKYRFGFTASATRADRKHPYMRHVIGPVIYRQKFHSKVPLEVRPIKTDFYYGMRGAWDWGNLLRALISNDDRNRQIAEVVDAEVKAGNSILVLSRRIEHLQRIADFIEEPVEILAAALRTKKERLEVLHQFREGKVKAVLATQLADEALDVPILSRVVLTHPGKHAGRIIQQVGRALREHPGKLDAVIYDVFDPKVGVLRRQWLQRKMFYRSEKIPIKGKRRLLRRRRATEAA
jgi:superfamily II DNA or RNA helicase